jgi:hypothetical protein
MFVNVLLPNVKKVHLTTNRPQSLCDLGFVELNQRYSTGIGTGADESFAGVAEESGSGTGAGASGDC